MSHLIVETDLEKYISTPRNKVENAKKIKAIYSLNNKSEKQYNPCLDSHFVKKFTFLTLLLYFYTFLDAIYRKNTG